MPAAPASWSAPWLRSARASLPQGSEPRAATTLHQPLAGLKTRRQRAFASALGAAVTYATVVACGARFTAELSSALWPPAGVALAVTFLAGPRIAWWLLAAFSLAYVSLGTPFGLSFLAAAVATSAVVLPVWVLSSVGFRYWLETRRDFVLLAASVGLSAGLAALVGPGLVHSSLAGGSPVPSLLRHPLEWWIGDASGALIVGTPLLLLASRVGTWQHRDRSWLDVEVAVLGAATVLLCALTFSATRPFALGLSAAIACLVLGFLTVLRLRPVEASVFSASLAIAIVLLSAAGRGPLAARPFLLGPAWMVAATLFCISMLISLLLREAHRSHTQARAAERLLRNVVDTIPALIQVKDSSGRLRFHNRAFADFVGRADNEIVGRRPDEIYRSHTGQVIAELDRATLESGQLQPYQEVRLRDHAGAARTYLQTKIPFDSGDKGTQLLTIALDITQRREAERAARETNERLQAVLSKIGGWLMVIDPEGTITYVSRPIGGLPVERVVGSKTSDWVTEEDYGHGYRMRQRALATRQTVSYEIKTRAPQVRWMSVVLSPIVENDRVNAFTMLLTDVTELRREAEENRRLREQMALMQKFESLGALAGGVAHDFNNLLVGILGNAQLIRRSQPEDSPDWRRADRLLKAAEKAAELCEQLLAYAGRNRTEMVMINANALLAELVAALGNRIAENARVELDTDPEVMSVIGDRAQLSRVLLNLITNASDALGGTAGTIRVATRMFVLDRAGLADCHSEAELPEGEYLAIEVSDTGCGITEDQRNRVFDPFFTTKFAGRGLGLAAALGIVRSHGGGIQVESEPGQGSTFRVLLPISGALPEFLPDTTPHAEEWTPELSRLRGEDALVLIADDEDSVLTMACATLEDAGFRVITARDGVEAWQAIERHRAELRAIVLDLTMPNMSGEEVLAKLRASGTTIPTLISSGFARGQVVSRLRLERDLHFLPKPYRPERLLLAVHRMVAARTASGQP